MERHRASFEAVQRVLRDRYICVQEVKCIIIDAFHLIVNSCDIVHVQMLSVLVLRHGEKLCANMSLENLVDFGVAASAQGYILHVGKELLVFLFLLKLLRHNALHLCHSHYSCDKALEDFNFLGFKLLDLLEELVFPCWVLSESLNVFLLLMTRPLCHVQVIQDAIPCKRAVIVPEAFVNLNVEDAVRVVLGAQVHQ